MAGAGVREGGRDEGREGPFSWDLTDMVRTWGFYSECNGR